MSEKDELENLDSQNETTEEVDKTEEVVEDDAPEADSEDEIVKLKETNKRIFERAKKAEAEVKELRAKAQEAKSTPSVDPDELRLIAKGLSDEEIEKARIIAKGQGITLQEALKDSMFLVFQKDFKEQQRKERAKLNASKGSGQADDETLVKPDMKREEHIDVWRKSLGR